MKQTFLYIDVIINILFTPSIIWKLAELFVHPIVTTVEPDEKKAASLEQTIFKTPQFIEITVIDFVSIELTLLEKNVATLIVPP